MPRNFVSRNAMNKAEFDNVMQIGLEYAKNEKGDNSINES